MDTSKPFIGYKSAGRRPERNNDREGAKGAPLAAIRGWIAGTAGLPGDLEGLVRMLPGIERKEPVLPTSDFYKEWLPLRGESAVERAFTEAGSLAGGAGVGSAVRAAKTGVSAGARGALSAVEAAARNAAVPRTLSPQAGVIKIGESGADESMEALRDYILSRRSAAASAPERKMLQGVYRGYSGEGRGEAAYHAGADFKEPHPGLFTTPDKRAAEQYQRVTGAPKLHSFESRARNPASEADLEAVLRYYKVFDGETPVGQYLEQGEGQITPYVDFYLNDLRKKGFDSVLLNDGMSDKPSLVALDPSVLRPAPELFASPQRRVADYYAKKRAAQTGEAPHVEMILIDPNSGREYTHATGGRPDLGYPEPMVTRARRGLTLDDVKDSTQLYSHGGAVNAHDYDPNRVDALVQALEASFER